MSISAHILGRLLSCSLILSWWGLSASAQAGQLADGQTFFNAPPLFQGATTTFSGVSIDAAKYYFSFSLPANAGEPIAQINFQQQPNPDPIDFDATQTLAFAGSQNNLGVALPIESSEWDKNTGILTVRLAPPIAPGTDFVVRLKPLSNPDVPGTYQFRVSAFPAGNSPQAMDLGVGQLQFYRNNW